MPSSSHPDQRVLLTGASGFIGRHCVAPLLSLGYEVHAVSSSARQEEASGLYWHQADLLREDHTRSLIAEVQPTHLLHLAWFVVPGRLISSPENVRWVQASLELLQQFAERGGRRVVMTGSCYEYSWERDDGQCTESTTPMIPDTLYGASKHALQLLLTAYSPIADLSSAWARVFFLYGPHEHPDRLVSSVTRALLAGTPARCSHGTQLRDYLYVRDVADALAALLHSSVEGPVNIGSGQPVPLSELVAGVGHLLGRSDLIEMGAIPAREGEAPRISADTARLNSEVGWQPRYGLKQGLTETVEWWKEQVERTHRSIE
jgi:nucleoside-diphosphate-sugar epimerase